ncbi:MAG: oligosaccharide repeat unit polymerase [Labilibaculum sp.]|nr:oligosaccharide repeat unit polymerase [Labilibaculum sp.]
MSSSYFELGLISSFLLYLLFTRKIVKKVGLLSLSFFFLFFFGLYSYSVPLSVILELPLGEYRKDYISAWEDVDVTLISFVLMNHLALFAMIIAYLLNVPKLRILKCQENNFNKRNFFRFAIILGCLSSVFELINFLRVGGPKILFSGKLAYQSAINDASLMLPSEIFFYLSIIFFTLSLEKVTLKKILFFISANVVYISFNMIIGERGTFVIALASSLIAYFYFRINISIKTSSIIIGLIFYVFFSVLTVYRNVYDSGLKVTFSDGIKYVKEHVDLIGFVLNPANSEFGTSCLNYRVAHDRTHQFEYRYGGTYLHVYSQLLPKVVNPFYDKSETIKYRDKYFPERGKKGSIGGTAYSSIYEAYLNFGYLGALIVFFLIFTFILNLEITRHTTISLFSVLIYVLCFELVILFPRSAFEYVFQKFIFIILLSFIVSVLARLRFKTTRK